MRVLLFESNPQTLQPQPLDVGSIFESISLCISAETRKEIILKRHIFVVIKKLKITLVLLGVDSSVHIEIIPGFELFLTILTIKCDG